MGYLLCILWSRMYTRFHVDRWNGFSGWFLIKKIKNEKSRPLFMEFFHPKWLLQSKMADFVFSFRHGSLRLFHIPICERHVNQISRLAKLSLWAIFPTSCEDWSAMFAARIHTFAKTAPFLSRIKIPRAIKTVSATAKKIKENACIYVYLWNRALKTVQKHLPFA